MVLSLIERTGLHKARQGKPHTLVRSDSSSIVEALTSHFMVLHAYIAIRQHISKGSVKPSQTRKGQKMGKVVVFIMPCHLSFITSDVSQLQPYYGLLPHAGPQYTMPKAHVVSTVNSREEKENERECVVEGRFQQEGSSNKTENSTRSHYRVDTKPRQDSPTNEETTQTNVH
jgi:hypothetical protein